MTFLLQLLLLVIVLGFTGCFSNMVGPTISRRPIPIQEPELYRVENSVILQFISEKGKKRFKRYELLNESRSRCIRRFGTDVQYTELPKNSLRLLSVEDVDREPSAKECLLSETKSELVKDIAYIITEDSKEGSFYRFVYREPQTDYIFTFLVYRKERHLINTIAKPIAYTLDLVTLPIQATVFMGLIIGSDW